MSETIFQQFIDKKNEQTSHASMSHLLRLCYAHNQEKSTINYNDYNDNIKNINLWRYFSGETKHTEKLSELLSKDSLDFSGVDFSGILPGTNDKYLSYFLANPAHKNAYENLIDLSNAGTYEMYVDENISKKIKQDILMFNDGIAPDNIKKLTNLYYHFPLEFINLLYDRKDITYDGMVKFVNDNVTVSEKQFDETIINSRLKSLTSKQDLSAQFNDLSENRLLTYKEQLIQYSPNLRKLINNFNLMRKDNDQLLYYFLWSLMNNTLDEKDLNKWYDNKKALLNDKNNSKSTLEVDLKKWNSIIDNSYTINIGESDDSEDSEDSDKLRQKLEMGYEIQQKFKKNTELDTSFCKKQIADLFIEHFTCKTPYDLNKNQLSEFYKNSTELYKNLCINPDNKEYKYLRPKLSILDIAFLCDDDMDETLLKILIPHIKHLRLFVKGMEREGKEFGKKMATRRDATGKWMRENSESASAAMGYVARGIGDTVRGWSEKFGDEIQRPISRSAADLSDEKKAR